MFPNIATSATTEAPCVPNAQAGEAPVCTRRLEPVSAPACLWALGPQPGVQREAGEQPPRAWAGDSPGQGGDGAGSIPQGACLQGAGSGAETPLASDGGDPGSPLPRHHGACGLFLFSKSNRSHPVRGRDLPKKTQLRVTGKCNNPIPKLSWESRRTLQSHAASVW